MSIYPYPQQPPTPTIRPPAAAAQAAPPPITIDVHAVAGHRVAIAGPDPDHGPHHDGDPDGPDQSAQRCGWHLFDSAGWQPAPRPTQHNCGRSLRPVTLPPQPTSKPPAQHSGRQLMPNFSIPLSGLDASNTALATISNNLANLNTTGYKDTTVNFQDMFYQPAGHQRLGRSAPGRLRGLGRLPSTPISAGGSVPEHRSQYGCRHHRQRILRRAERQQHLLHPRRRFHPGLQRLSGHRRWLPSDGLSRHQRSGKHQRRPHSDSIADGHDQSAHGNHQPLHQANLSASAAVGDSYNTSVTVYDSLGTAHVLNVDFTNTAPVGVTTPPYPAATSPAAPAQTPPWRAALSPSTAAETSPAPRRLPSTSGLADGASTLAFNWDLASSSGRAHHPGRRSQRHQLHHQNGNTSGSLTGFTINSDGTIYGHVHQRNPGSRPDRSGQLCQSPGPHQAGR